MDPSWTQEAIWRPEKCFEKHVENDNEKTPKKKRPKTREPVNPLSAIYRAGAPLPEPLSFSRIGRCLHLLARIAEAIRVLSGIRRAGAKLQLHGVSGAGPC